MPAIYIDDEWALKAVMKSMRGDSTKKGHEHLRFSVAQCSIPGACQIGAQMQHMLLHSTSRCKPTQQHDDARCSKMGPHSMAHR